MNDEDYMQLALEQARQAYQLGEVPIGAVIVHKDRVIGQGYNLRNTEKNPLRHAEITAIDQAATALGDWRLEESTLYVTVEPCPMCAGAILQARIPRVVFGVFNPKAGCAGSILDLFHDSRFNHQVEVTTGVCAADCQALMQDFFKDLRSKRQKKKTATEP